MEEGDVVITQELIESFRSPRGGWTQKILAELGVAWPPKHGWKNEISGKVLPKANVDRLELLTGHKIGGAPTDSVIGNCKLALCSLEQATRYLRTAVSAAEGVASSEVKHV